MAEVKLTPEQQAVVDNRGGTLLVSAAAGSGKTKVLVDRVLKQITQEGKNINEFLIITFTNAAAAELRAKISTAISKELARQPGNRHLARQMNLLHMSQISTVHAFCGGLVKQFGYILELPAELRILEEGEKKDILARVIDKVLGSAYEKAEPDFLHLTDTLGAGRNDSDLVELLKNLQEKLESQPDPQKWIKKQNPHFPEDTKLGETVWGRIFLDDCKMRLNWFIGRYRWAVSAMEGDEKLEKSYLPAYKSQLSALEAMIPALDAPWDEIKDGLEMDFGRPSVRGYGDQAFLDEIKAVRTGTKALLEDILRVVSRPEAELIAEQNEMAPALSCLLKLAWQVYEAFSAEKRRKNVMDFSDQEHLAIRLLTEPGTGAPTDIAREISGRFTEIMVDEYQDSNRVQELIFSAICKNGDTNRFLVGDVKQSIYSFRQAEPEIFLEKYQTFRHASTAEPGEPRKLLLSRNFRSRPEVLEAVNHVFQTVMSRRVGDLAYDADQQLYQGLDSYPAMEGPLVELHVLELQKAGEQDDTKYQKEAAWVTCRIAELLTGEARIRDGDGTRPVRPEDIAILFRSRDAIHHYARALKQADIPVATDTGDNFFETPEITLLHNLLQVIENPHLDIPLLSVLCSPLFRLSNDQLAKVRSVSRQARFYDAMQECEEPWCRETVQKLEEMRERAANISADVLVWQLLHDMNILTTYGAMEGGSLRQENLLRFYELARTAAKGGYLYLYQFLRNLEYTQKSGTVSVGGGTNGVQLMTIHKSKGMEFPVVFLADMSRSFNFRDLSSSLLVDSDLGLAAKYVDLGLKIRYPGICFEGLKIKAQQKSLSEEMRILYVAMTRAKDRLIMTYGSQYTKNVLGRLRTGAGNPAETWAAAGAACPGDWILLSALSRVESGALFEECGRPSCNLHISEHPWRVEYHKIEQVHPPKGVWTEYDKDDAAQNIPSPAQLLGALLWNDPNHGASVTPSKVTATQLKGRQKDQEAAESAVVQARAPQLKRPEFILAERGLSATEQGTAMHLFLQYADFSACTTRDGVIGEIDRLCDDSYLTELQAEAVVPEYVVALFNAPLGKRILGAKELIREFKFSVLTDAGRYYPEASGEEILLQGVVDAAIIDEDGITVIDFKTDRVTKESAHQRGLHYRGQLETYRDALEQIFHKPVKEMILCFLAANEEVRY